MIDFDDVATAMTDALQKASDEMREQLGANLTEAIGHVFDHEIGDFDEYADDEGYPAGEPGADDESTLDALRAAFEAGYAKALEVAREAFESANNV